MNTTTISRMLSDSHPDGREFRAAPLAVAVVTLAAWWGAGCSGGHEPVDILGPGPGVGESPISETPGEGVGPIDNSTAAQATAAQAAAASSTGSGASSTGGNGDCNNCAAIVAAPSGLGDACPGSAAAYSTTLTCLCSNCAEECSDSACSAPAQPPSSACGSCGVELCSSELEACSED